MLVNCVAYHRGQKLSDIPLGEVRTHLQRPDCFVWVALKDPQPEELASLQEPPLTRRLADAVRPRSPTGEKAANRSGFVNCQIWRSARRGSTTTTAMHPVPSSSSGS